jgi:hypothetical protein
MRTPPCRCRFQRDSVSEHAEWALKAPEIAPNPYADTRTNQKPVSDATMGNHSSAKTSIPLLVVRSSGLGHNLQYFPVSIPATAVH